MSSPRQSLRTAGVAVRAMAVLTVVLGVGYTAVVTGIGQLALPAQADGSLVSADGQVVGSSLIGQSFQDSDGDALPEWFQSRPSAAGDGYDASASSGSNLGPENDDLVSSIEDRKAAIAESDGVDPSSPEYAREQVTRVAEARGIPEQQVERLVDAHVQGRDLGYLGEPTVNVLELNIALAGLGG
jgi:K+-transporting ATPase ATPase C chain